jgi:hypothetical protein
VNVEIGANASQITFASSRVKEARTTTYPTSSKKIFLKKQLGPFHHPTHLIVRLFMRNLKVILQNSTTAPRIRDRHSI